MPLRGMIAPASLKPRPAGIRRTIPRGPLRGMIAPASLKPGLLGAASRRIQPTPGHDCPGLIEARIGSLNLFRRLPDHSGA